MAPLFGVLRARRYTFQWSSLLILAYFAEGATRGWADSGLSRTLALAVIVIPVVVRTTEDMLLLVPNALREAAKVVGDWRLTDIVTDTIEVDDVIPGWRLPLAELFA